MEKSLKKADELFKDGIYARSLELYEKVIKERFNIYDKEAFMYKQKPLKKKSEVRLEWE
jgi:hypothetical protein